MITLNKLTVIQDGEFVHGLCKFTFSPPSPYNNGLIEMEQVAGIAIYTLLTPAAKKISAEHVPPTHTIHEQEE